MRKLTRREIREFLLQSLYSRSVTGTSFDLASFATCYYDHPMDAALEDPYFLEVYAGVMSKEGELLEVIRRFAPKFDVQIMPLVNLLPIFIGSYEMLYLTADAVPEKVSINEAVELAKRFSDDGAREMVNGVLNTLKERKAEIAGTLLPGAPQFFA